MNIFYYMFALKFFFLRLDNGINLIDRFVSGFNHASSYYIKIVREDIRCYDNYYYLKVVFFLGYGYLESFKKILNFGKNVYY